MIRGDRQSRSTLKEVQALAERLCNGEERLESGLGFDAEVILSLLTTVMARYGSTVSAYLSNHGIEKFLAVCPPGTKIQLSEVDVTIQVDADRQRLYEFHDHLKIDLQLPDTVYRRTQSDFLENGPIREYFLRKTSKRFSKKIFWRDLAKQILDGEAIQTCVRQVTDDILDEIFTETSKSLEKNLRELGLILFNEPDKWHKLPVSQQELLRMVYRESKGCLTAVVELSAIHSRTAGDLIKKGLLKRVVKGKYQLTILGKEIANLSISQ
jgi:hypothetical protein